MNVNTVKAQSILQLLGLYRGKIDGVAGPATEEALLDLQHVLDKEGFDPGPFDGVWGGKTEAALANYLDEKGVLLDSHQAVLARPKPKRLDGTGPIDYKTTTWKGFINVDPLKLDAALPVAARLLGLGKTFTTVAEQYDLNPLFMIAVAQLETANFTSNAFKNKKNAMGVSNSKGPLTFNSYYDSIVSAARSLTRPGGYYSKAKTLEDIWYVYSPPSFKQKGGKPVSNDFHNTNGHWGPQVVRNWNNLIDKVK